MRHCWLHTGGRTKNKEVLKSKAVAKNKKERDHQKGQKMDSSCRMTDEKQNKLICCTYSDMLTWGWHNLLTLQQVLESISKIEVLCPISRSNMCWIQHGTKTWWLKCPCYPRKNKTSHLSTNLPTGLNHTFFLDHQELLHIKDKGQGQDGFFLKPCSVSTTIFYYFFYSLKWRSLPDPHKLHIAHYITGHLNHPDRLAKP